MPQISKIAKVGIAREVTNNVYLPPTDFIPFTKADYEDKFEAIKDESFRGNDSGLQGLYQGVSEADWNIDLDAYPDITGYFLRGIIGPDTVTPGVTTKLGSASTAGATSLSVTDSVPAQSTVRIGTGDTAEYATVSAVSGSGPYSLTVAGLGSGGGLANDHSVNEAVVSSTLHSFKQSILPADRATFSLTMFDTLITSSYSGAAIEELDIKIDPKKAVTLTAKMKSFQAVSAPPQVPVFSPQPPALGWQWTMVNGGGASDRGLTLDWKLKRKIDVIHSSAGFQRPRDIFQGAIDLEGKYKAIYESQADMDLFAKYIQKGVTAKLTQPLSSGGAVMTISTAKGGFHTGKRAFSSSYVEAEFDISGIFNSSDGGLCQATLANFRAAAY